jgi:hypothetical protein
LQAITGRIVDDFHLSCCRLVRRCDCRLGAGVAASNGNAQAA